MGVCGYERCHLPTTCCLPSPSPRCQAVDPRKLERLTLRVQRQQERKRQRTAQELQRRLEEIEVSLRSLEHRGVLVERALRGEEDEEDEGGCPLPPPPSREVEGDAGE